MKKLALISIAVLMLCSLLACKGGDSAAADSSKYPELEKAVAKQKEFIGLLKEMKSTDDVLAKKDDMISLQLENMKLQIEALKRVLEGSVAEAKAFLKLTEQMNLKYQDLRGESIKETRRIRSLEGARDKLKAMNEEILKKVMPLATEMRTLTGKIREKAGQ